MGRQRHWPSAKQMACVVTLPLLSVATSTWALEAAISGVSGQVSDNIGAYLETIDAEQYTDTRLEGGNSPAYPRGHARIWLL